MGAWVQFPLGAQSKIQSVNQTSTGINFDFENNKKSKQPEPQPTPEIKNQDEITLIEDLIDELVSKPNKTEKDKNNIDLLRIKLGQLRNG